MFCIILGLFLFLFLCFIKAEFLVDMSRRILFPPADWNTLLWSGNFSVNQGHVPCSLLGNRELGSLEHGLFLWLDSNCLIISENTGWCLEPIGRLAEFVSFLPCLYWVIPFMILKLRHMALQLRVTSPAKRRNSVRTKLNQLSPGKHSLHYNMNISLNWSLLIITDSN